MVISRIIFCVIVSIPLLLTGCRETYVLLDYLNGTGGNASLTLALTPENPVVSTLGTTIFVASGGTLPYTYSVVSGPGSIDPTTGEYSSSSDGSALIRAVDATGARGETTVDVIATGATGVWITPTSVVLDAGEEITFNGGGGDGSYTFTITYGDGTIDPVTGAYTASFVPLGVGVALIEIEDGAAATAQAAVNIRDPGEAFSVTPLSVVMRFGESVIFTATGATPLVFWNTGYISSSPSMSTGDSATYTPTATGSAMVYANDDSGAGDMVIRTVIVLEP